MAATTKDRATPKYYIEREITLDLKAGSVIPAGVIVCTDATGLAVNGADTAGLICQGVSAHAADQTKGDTKVVVERGVFGFDNNAGAIVAADVGKLALIVDNQTITDAATANNIGCGYIEEVRADGYIMIAMLGGKIAAA